MERELGMAVAELRVSDSSLDMLVLCSRRAIVIVLDGVEDAVVEEEVEGDVVEEEAVEVAGVTTEG